MSSGMQILAVDGSPILDWDAIRRALLTLYKADVVSGVITSRPPFPQSSIQVKPVGEPSFSVRLGSDRSSCSVDGDSSQNNHVVVALRAVIPATATRIVAVDLHHVENFAELPSGITLEQLESSWRPLSEFDENA